MTSRTESHPTWNCPPLRPMTSNEVAVADGFYSSISDNATWPSGAMETAGLELRVALMLLEKGGSFPAADNPFWKRKCRSLFLRPAMEPIASTYWGRFGVLDVDASTALKMASALAGRPLVYRKGPAIGQSATGDVHFGPLVSVDDWLQNMQRVARTPELLPGLPVYCFANTIMTHPFSDGNGRVARVMVHAALARNLGLDSPKIALAPAFYRRGEALASALNTLNEHGDWSKINRVFFSVLDEAALLTRALHSRICR
ncbi:MAG: hypothetical protein E6G92_03260 [Alphaproteobacteria bacterium]|nr:MAG: hypothetical protein E6G92_03260 [Alphaproteobacteria bacterium]